MPSEEEIREAAARWRERLAQDRRLRALELNLARQRGVLPPLVPDRGDDDAEVGPTFDPDVAGAMLDKQRTPSHSLQDARRIALKNGLYYAYTGNVHDEDGGSTCRFS